MSKVLSDISIMHLSQDLSAKVGNANCSHVDECITILPLRIGKINEAANQSK